MRYLSRAEVEETHAQMIDTIGGSHGVRDPGAIESAVAQPQLTFGGNDLYPTLADKAAALSFSLVCNHPFVDGNKRVGHAAAVLFLRHNGHDLAGDDAEHERVILSLAAGDMERDEFVEWIRAHVQPGDS